MTFRHDASAAALGGFLTRPFTQPLSVQAASVLAPVGGYGSARVEGFRFEKMVSFDAGYTQVIGTRRQRVEDGKTKTVYETLACAVVEGLNILDMVTADRVVSRLASEYVEGTPHDELPFRPVGTYFVNLRIAGLRVGDDSGELRPRADLLRHHTSSGVLANCVEGQKQPLADVEGKPIQRVPRCDALRQAVAADYPHKVRLPLFELDGLNVPGAAKPVGRGCVIEIPSFGTITLGELVVSPVDRRLTMIIVELHSPEEGMIAVGPVEGNGGTY